MKIYCLRFDHFGKGDTLVLNSECATRADAETLLFDRNATGVAFRGEYVALMRWADYLRESNRYVPAGYA